MPTPMPKATTIVRRAAVRADRVADTVSLDHEGRSALPETLVAEGGLGFTVALTKAAPWTTATRCASTMAGSSRCGPPRRTCSRCAPRTPPG